MGRFLRFLPSFVLALTIWAPSHVAFAQAVKGSLAPDAPPAAVSYHGLVPGLDTMDKVKAALGEPAYAGKWYNFKMYYPAKDRPGLIDVVHMHGDKPESQLAEIEAASVPEGFATEAEIRAELGGPEYELRMATWRMLDYTSRGVRFALDPDGTTIGVAYLPQRAPRVPPGERTLMDLTHLREGPQPAPARPASLRGLQAGAAEVDITPAGEDWLGHRYTVVTPLKSRIVVFSDGELTVALVGADLFGVGFTDNLAIRDRAKALGVDHTIVASSHNHASGDTIGVYGHYPTEYIKHIQDQTVAGIEQALVTMQPVKELRAASRELPMDGIRVQGLFRNARNPGVLDPTVSTLQAIGADGKPIAVIVHFACHVESLEKGPREVSADFPGYMCDQMKTDGLGQPIFLNGAVGGMVSGDNPARTHESSREMGLQLAAIVRELVTSGVQPAEFAFQADRRPLHIPGSNQDFIARYKSGARELVRGRIVTDMTYVRLGEAQFVTLPGELLPEVSFEILERMDGYPRMLLGLANDQIGYMVPPYDFRDDYYEETMSQGPATAIQVRDMALRMLADEAARRPESID
jgi:hypothetical protein